MKSTRQQTALNLWLALPHLLIWLSWLAMCIFFSYGTWFQHITPALPLITALILAWDAPPPTMQFSLLLSGMAYDLLAGLPFGFTGLSWIGIYLLHARKKFDIDHDEPFITRYLIILMWIACYIGLEWLGSALLHLQYTSFGMMLARFALMMCLTPSVALGVAIARKRLYRRLWVFLPHDIRPA